MSNPDIEAEVERKTCAECGGLHVSELPPAYRLRKWLAQLIDPGPISRTVSRTIPREEQMVLDPILGHPKNMPTWEWLCYVRNVPENLDEKGLRSRLSWLRAHDLVQPVSAESPDGTEYQMYALTEKSIDAVINSHLDISQIREDYVDLIRTDEIRELEGIPRPPLREYRGFCLPEASDE